MGYQPPQRGHPTSGRGGVKNPIIKALATVYGFATPEGTHPTGRHITVMKAKIFGGVFIFLGLATAYFFILLPIEEGKRTGVMHQGPFGLVMPIVLLYCGIAGLVTDLRDEKTMRAEQGRLRWTSKGRIFQYGLWVTTALILIAWYLYVRSIGLYPS